MSNLTRNFKEIKLTPVCFVMVLPFLLQLESHENALGVMRYLQGPSMERKLENAQKAHSDQSQQITLYKEMSQQHYDHAEELQELWDLVPVVTARDYAVRKNTFDTRNLAIKLGTNATQHADLRGILATWEGDVAERSINTELKDEEKNLREDKDKYDEKFGTLLKYIKDTTDPEINQLVLNEETLRVRWKRDGEEGLGEMRVRPRSEIYTAVKEAITENLRGDAESTRSHIRDMLYDLPKVTTYTGLKDNIAAIESIRILLERHTERFGGAAACVDADFKNALKRSLIKGTTQIDVARITLEQMRGDTPWLTMKRTMHELINSNLAHIMPTVQPAHQHNVPQLRFQDAFAGAGQGVLHQRGGAPPSRGGSRTGSRKGRYINAGGDHLLGGGG